MIVGVAVVAFVAGVWLVGMSEQRTSEPTPPREEAGAVTIGSPLAADLPIELAPEMEPYDYRPAPPHEPTPVDGFYIRVFTIEEMVDRSSACRFTACDACPIASTRGCRPCCCTRVASTWSTRSTASGH